MGWCLARRLLPLMQISATPRNLLLAVLIATITTGNEAQVSPDDLSSWLALEARQFGTFLEVL